MDPAPIGDSALAQYADDAWALLRRRIGGNSGVHWDSAGGRWQADPAWTLADDAGQTAYSFEQDLTGALALAAATSNRPRLSEIAGFYAAYQIRFRRLDEVLRRSAAVGGKSTLLPQGPADALVLPWMDRTHGTPWPSECALCTSQGMYPAGRLLHLISLVPGVARTPEMLEFTRRYTPLLSHDVVIRFAYQTRWLYNQPEGKPFVLMDQWRGELEGHSGPARYRMLDRDLWLMAIATEVLAAHHEDPALVPLVTADSTSLRRFVDAGLQMLQSRRGSHQVGRDESGTVVSGDLFFRGDFDREPDMAFAADTDATYPEASHPMPPRGGGWDLSHIRRLPTTLRSFWDARLPLGLMFPDSAALAQVANQYLYVAYRRGWPGPLFRNFFDGNDGWYRVGQNGHGDWTYGPSSSCDNADPTRHCLSRQAVAGWQLLRFAAPGLGEVADRMFALAADTSSSAAAFRRRVYLMPEDPFTWSRAGHVPYSILLAELIGETLLGKQRGLPRQ